MTFEEWYAIDSDREFATAKDFCRFVWQAATEQSQARLELGIDLLEQHAKAMLAETRVAELEAEVAMLQKVANEDQAEINMLRESLEVIAGKRQCLDNCLSNLDVAREALTATSDDWLKRHDAETIANFLEQSGKWVTNDAMLAKRDAEVLRKAAGMLEYGVRKTMADQLCDMADELEGDAK